jgi:hypothetical protein
MGHSLIGMISMTIGVLQFTVVPPIVDFSRTHATNPAWPRHARFHVVTQVLTTSGIGLIALFCLWSDRMPPNLGICFATILSLVALGGFFLSALSARFYDGAVSADETSPAILFGAIDGNVANFGSAMFAVVLGRLIV